MQNKVLGVGRNAGKQAGRAFGYWKCLGKEQNKISRQITKMRYHIDNVA